jgi:chorismate synthase
MPLTLITAGESHGPGLTCVVEGLPAGLQLDREALDRDMARRQLGHGRGGRMKIESDRAQVTAGVRHGRTLGGPIALQVANRDYANWEDRMNPWPVDAEVAEVHLPRPGHADLVGTQKYGLTDVRDVLERASARETAGPRGRRRAGQGVPARARRRGRLPRRADRDGPAGARRAPDARRLRGVDDDPVRCLDPEASRAMVQHINVQRKANESIGGTFEVLAFGLVPGSART